MSAFTMVHGGRKLPLRFAKKPHRGPVVRLKGHQAHMFDAAMKFRRLRPALTSEYQGLDGVSISDGKVVIHHEEEGTRVVHQEIPIERTGARFIDSVAQRFGDGVLELTQRGEVAATGQHVSEASYQNWMRFTATDLDLLGGPQLNSELFAAWPKEALQFARGLQLFVWLSYDWSGLQQVKVLQDSLENRSNSTTDLFENPSDAVQLADAIREGRAEQLIYTFKFSGQVYSFAFLGESIIPVVNSAESDVPSISFKEFNRDLELVIRGQRHMSRFGSMVTFVIAPQFPAVPLVGESDAVMLTLKKKPQHPFSDRAMQIYNSALELLGIEPEEVEMGEAA